LFCERLEKVTCIELSKKRSTINALRNRNFQNLEIMVGNLKDIEINEKYDFVTLVGVLEYSPQYIDIENPFSYMIEKSRNYLKKDGKLIIAIENRLGLKYLAGASEDHTGKVFDGVNNYLNISNVKTLTKCELIEMLQENGFTRIEFYYPLPDYKMPTIIYSDEYLPQKGDLRNIKYTYDRDRIQTFDEEIVFDQLCNDGKFDYFANSFLIFASK